MKIDISEFVIYATIVFIAGMLTGAALRTSSVTESSNQRAIEAGVGEYVADPKTSATQTRKKQ